MKRKLLVVVVAAISISLVGVPTSQSAPELPISKFMQQKLEHAQKVLEGLALEDFESISKNAQAMTVLGQAASWRVLQTPEYVQHSSEFLRLTKQLDDMATEKNLDGAALSYVQLTINCVNCHKHVRSIRAASLDTSLPTLR